MLREWPFQKSCLTLHPLFFEVMREADRQVRVLQHLGRLNGHGRVDLDLVGSTW